MGGAEKHYNYQEGTDSYRIEGPPTIDVCTYRTCFILGLLCYAFLIFLGLAFLTLLGVLAGLLYQLFTKYPYWSFAGLCVVVGFFGQLAHRRLPKEDEPPKQPGAIKQMYWSWKDKYCKQMVVE